MSRQTRSTRLGLAVALGAALLAALCVVAIAAARPTGHATAAKTTASHKCLTMAGAGDGAFTKNFNPFTGTGLPSGQVVKGAIYEGLTVSPEGGKPTLPWLAKSWKWSNGNKTLTLQLAKGVKWSDGKALTSVDVVYSLTAGKQNKVMDIIGYTRPDTNIASITAKGAYAVAINLKTADSQFIAATLNGAIVIPRHIWSHVADPSTFTNPHPVGSGPFNRILRFTPQDYVLGKNPTLLAVGQAAHSLPRVRPGVVERRVAGTGPERPGRLDAQLRPERRQGVRGQGQGALPLLLRHDGLPGLAGLRQHAVSVQPRRLPACTVDGDRSQHGLEAR